MKRYRLKIAESDFRALERHAREHLPLEAAVFALIGVADRPNEVDILIRRVLSLDKDDYVQQLTYHLEVSTRAINGLAALCEANGLAALVCHAHGNASDYSSSDDFGEARVFSGIRPFVPRPLPMASLLFNKEGLRGRVWLPGRSRPVPLDEVIVIGRSIRRIRREPTDRDLVDAIFHRQALAFGEAGQRLIAGARVGIVGSGGTGSPTANQLARLGVRDIVVIDPDAWDPTNVTRVYGTAPAGTHDHRKKVERVVDHLKLVAPTSRIVPVPENVVLRSAAKRLLDRDVIFLCTDDHWGRSVVNQLAYQYLVPTVNLGVSIASGDGRITAARGVVDMLRPDVPCLWCRQTLRAERIAAESLPREMRKGLEREGYVEGLDEPAPAVISINTTVSGLAVTLFLQLLTDFMGEPGDIWRLNYEVLEGTVARGRSAVADSCVCRKVRAFGDLRPLPVLEEVPD